MGREEHEARLRILEQDVLDYLAEKNDSKARDLMIRITGGESKQFVGETNNTSTEGADEDKELAKSQITAFNISYDEGVVNSLYGNEIGVYFARRKQLNEKAKQFGLEEIPNLRKDK